MKIKKIVALLILSLLISIALSVFAVDNDLHYVESAVVSNDKVYGIEKNGEWYKLFQCNLDGTEASYVVAQKIVGVSDFYEFESLFVEGTIVEIKLKKTSLDDSDEVEDLYYYYNFENADYGYSITPYTDTIGEYYLQFLYSDGVINVDYYGNIYSCTEDEETVIFENDGSILSVENIGYVYYEDCLVVYNATNQEFYAIELLTGVITPVRDAFPELALPEDLNIEEYGELSYFTVYDNIVCGIITDEGELLPLVLQDDTVIVESLVDSWEMQSEEITTYFLWVFFALLILFLFYNKFPTIGKIFVFSMIAIFVTYLYASQQLNELQLEEMVTAEIRKLSLQVNLVEIESEDSYEDLIEQVELSLESSNVYTETGEGLVETSSVESRYNIIIQVTDAGYHTWDAGELYYAPTNNLYLQEVISALDMAVEERVIVSSVNPYIYNTNSITIYIPIIRSDDSVQEVLCSTYFYKDVDTSSYVASIIHPFMKFLLMVAIVILLICGYTFAIVSRVNKSLKRDGKYFAKRYGFSEIGKLKEMISNMSESMQWKLENSSVVNQACEPYIPQELIELFGKKDISEFELGDEVVVSKTLLLINSNNFIEIEKQMDNQQAFEIVDNVFKTMSICAQQYNGFVSGFDDMNGMAIFQQETQGVKEAILCGDSILSAIENNKEVVMESNIRFGGAVISAEINAGVVGSKNRMEILMVSEDLEKAKEIAYVSYKYQTGVLIDYKAAKLIPELQQKETIRFFGTMDDALKTEENYLYEDFSGQSEEQCRLKKLTKEDFEQGVVFMLEQQYKEARTLFMQVLKKNSHDNIAYHYFSICNDKINEENEVNH